MSQPLPRYERATIPPAMRLTGRDGQLLDALYRYDGVLARRHIRELFWPGASEQAMERRLSTLYHNGFLKWPSLAHRRTRAIPESIVWLGWRGALLAASGKGIGVKAPAVANESRLRELARALRAHDFRWQREPRWDQLGHDLAVVDFRLGVERAVRETPWLALETWLPEGAFLADMDQIEYPPGEVDPRGRPQRRGVRPDGYFAIVNHRRRVQGEGARQRLLLELDGASYDNARFGREKVGPGVAYIKSPEFRARFGYNSGRWLVVVAGGRERLKHLRRQTARAAGTLAGWFWFATLEAATDEERNVLTAPIWSDGRGREGLALFRDG